MENKKDNEVSVGGQNFKNSLILGLFEKDTYLLFIYKKSERIVSAFYLISNLLSDNEPLKWQFRNTGLGVISQVLSSRLTQKDTDEVLHVLAMDFIKLLSLLDVAFVAGVISEMNFKLLKQELENLLEVLNTRGLSSKILPERTASIDINYFSIPKEQLVSNNQDTVTKSFSAVYPQKPVEGHNFETDRLNENRQRNKGSKGQKKIQRNSIKDKINSVPRQDVYQADSGIGGSERERLIIDLLKTKSNLNVRDFTEVIKGYSDKTIQRELLRLVSLGVLKKVGERRWSRYSLA